MDLSRQEYPALLTSLQPTQAITVLNDRVRTIIKINLDIAEWLSERRRIEETYAQALRKLSKRPQLDGGLALGIFQIPWQRIVSMTESLAQSHETLAQKIEVDVETPLRQFASQNREMQSMATTQGNLASIAKDVDSAQKKAEKAKGSKADRYVNASSGVEDANQQWDSQAPYVFAQLQSLDETRVNHLRDVLTQFQTHEVDQVEKSRTSAESCLNALLNVETADEIKTYAAKIRGSRGSISRHESSALASARPSSSSMASTPMPSTSRSSQTPGLPGANDRLAPAVPEKSHRHSTIGGGIKRLGTVMGRRKNATPPPVAAAEKKKEKLRFPFRRGESSRSFQEVESTPVTGHDLTPVTSRNESISTPQRPPSTGRQAMVVQPDVHAIGKAPMINGLSDQTQAPPLGQTPSEQPSIINDLAQTNDQPPHELSGTPPSPTQQVLLSTDPITRAQREAAAANAESEDTLRNLTIRDQPIPEDEDEAKQALNSMANQLRLQAQSSGVNRVQGSMRGRRDVRNTVFVLNPNPSEEMSPVARNTAASAGPITPSMAHEATTIASPIKRAGTSGTLLEEHHLSDTTSVRSSHSLAGLVQHPELHEPGLNASIIETVSTWLSDGKVSKSFVVGEVALAYNSPTIAGVVEQESEALRLENFQVLEKVAANPAFIVGTGSGKGKEKAGTEERAGEYSVSLAPIRRPTPSVAFKYQLHLDEANPSAYSPIMLTLAWQIEESQASVIIFYSINPTFSSSSSSFTLKNVVLSVALDTSSDGGRAVNAMMAPTTGASFKRKQSLVIWSMPELVVDIEHRKLLARFMTSGSAPKAGAVEAKWELPGITGSGLGVSALAAEAKETSNPFADDGVATTPARAWNQVPSARKLVSGRYSAS